MLAPNKPPPEHKSADAPPYTNVTEDSSLIYDRVIVYRNAAQVSLKTYERELDLPDNVINTTIIVKDVSTVNGVQNVHISSVLRMQSLSAEKINCVVITVNGDELRGKYLHSDSKIVQLRIANTVVTVKYRRIDLPNEARDRIRVHLQPRAVVIPQENEVSFLLTGISCSYNYLISLDTAIGTLTLICNVTIINNNQEKLLTEKLIAISVNAQIPNDRSSSPEQMAQSFVPQARSAAQVRPALVTAEHLHAGFYTVNNRSKLIPQYGQYPIFNHNKVPYSSICFYNLLSKQAQLGLRFTTPDYLPAGEAIIYKEHRGGFIFVSSCDIPETLERELVDIYLSKPLDLLFDQVEVKESTRRQIIIQAKMKPCQKKTITVVLRYPRNNAANVTFAPVPMHQTAEFFEWFWPLEYNSEQEQTGTVTITMTTPVEEH